MVPSPTPTVLPCPTHTASVGRGGGGAEWALEHRQQLLLVKQCPSTGGEQDRRGCWTLVVVHLTSALSQACGTHQKNLSLVPQPELLAVTPSELSVPRATTHMDRPLNWHLIHKRDHKLPTLTWQFVWSSTSSTSV